MATVLEGIIVGGAGGAVAGITISLIQFCGQKIRDYVEGRRIYLWLEVNSSNNRGNKFRSTRAIASWNNLTEDRVRYLCSTHKKIYQSTGQKEDMWSIHQRGDEEPRIS